MLFLLESEILHLANNQDMIRWMTVSYHGIACSIALKKIEK